MILLSVATVNTNGQLVKQAVGGGIRPHGRLARTEFYDTPVPLAPASAGSLIRSEQADGYALPPGILVTRFLYHSQSSRDDDVAVSGVVLVPDGDPPPQGWPIIAWAHGFLGIAHDCAPSLLENLGEGSYFAMYAKLGYAVVVTDYAGLGTNFQSSYLNLRSNAFDVIAAVRAARRAIPQLGARWIAMGEGEGSVVAGAVTETVSEIQDQNFLGSIGLGGLVDSENIANGWMQGDPTGMIYVAQGVKAEFPEFEPSEILTAQVMPYYRKALDSCDAVSELPPLSANQVLKQNWPENRFIKQYFAVNTLGRKPASRPILILISDSPSSVPVAFTDQAVKRLCSQRDLILYKKLKSRDSKALIGDSVGEQIAWIQARFSNQTPESNCN
ncbi:MAG: lipase family protein [Candidatus Acidiferrum sp.]